MKKVAIGILTLALSFNISLPSWADTVIEKVAKTGVLTAGTTDNRVPFAYVDAQGNWVGYSIDILSLIADVLEQQLGREITLELVKVDVPNSVPAILEDKVDIICSTTSFTWNREEYVDFSLPYFVTGTRLLVKKDGALATIGSPEALKGKRIGIIAGTVNENDVKLAQPQATLVPVSDGKQGLEALEKGQIDAFASDGILLLGLIAANPNAKNLSVVPQSPYKRYAYACMIPEGNSEFRDLVNVTIAEFLQGYIQEEPLYVEIFDQWFGPKGIIPIPRDSVVNEFSNIIDMVEQIRIGN